MTGNGVADVVIIGAGVVGTAIARTGFDTVPGSLESRLLRRGSGLLHDYARRAGIPVERTGALVVAWTDEQESALPGIEDKARRNGCTDVRRITAADLYRAEPRLGPGARGAIEIPGESIICPWTTPLAYATEALREGVRLRLRTRVTGVRGGGRVAGDPGGGGGGGGEGGAGERGAWEHSVATSAGPLRCRWLINA